MAMRRQPISPPPPASSERGRPYPARPASDSSMFRPPVQRCSWVTAPRSHDGKGIQPDDEYHRRLKASSKRDRQKLAREDKYALDPSLAQVAPEHACARCKSQRWRCYIDREPHAPRRTCLPCGNNKCTFGGSKSRPPTVAEATASPVSIILPLPCPTSHRYQSVSIASSANTLPSSSASSTSDRMGLVMVDNKLPRPRLAPLRPMLLKSEFPSYRSLAPTPPRPWASLPTPQLSPAIGADAFPLSHYPTFSREDFLLPPCKNMRPLSSRHIRTPERTQNNRRISVPALLSSPTPSTTHAASAPATPAAIVNPYRKNEYMQLEPHHHTLSNTSYRGSTYDSSDMPTLNADRGPAPLLLDCAERSPRDPRSGRIADSMLGGVREQWVSSISAAQHRGKAPHMHNTEAQFQMGKGLRQAWCASRAMDGE